MIFRINNKWESRCKITKCDLFSHLKHNNEEIKLEKNMPTNFIKLDL